MARHPNFPQAFTRSRKLPLPGLIAALLSMLDSFFGALFEGQAWSREVSDRAFAKAREHLHRPALTSLNNLVVQRADEAGWVDRWQGLRVVAADASVLMPALRLCLKVRSAATPDQRLFALYLPGAELTLHASVHSAQVSERAMLMEALEVLGPDDVLVLDRGYPAAWLVALLNARGIRFVMRCDKQGGWKAVRDFVRSGQQDGRVRLSKPSRDEVRDWGCPADAPEVRLVRQMAPNGQVRVLATHLAAGSFPAAGFAALYHQRWRIEEAFKRLKHRLHIECVSGLSQQALIIDIAAKVLADNLASLMCGCAQEAGGLAARSRKCNRSYSAGLMQRFWPRLLLMIGDVVAAITQALHLLGATTQRLAQKMGSESLIFGS